MILFFFILGDVIIIITASTVKFSQLTYSAAVYNGPLQPVLILSNSLSINITVQVLDSNDTAVGE